MEHILIKNEADYRAFVQKCIDGYLFDVYGTKTPFHCPEHLEETFDIEFADLEGNFASDWSDSYEAMLHFDGAELDFTNFRIKSPFEYPCVLVYAFGRDFDRIGDFTTRILYDIPLKSIFEELEGDSKCRTYF